MTTLELAALASAAGTDLGFSRWFEITQERVNQFAEATEDRQWIHVDEERARSGPFGATIAHGFLTLSLVAAALEDLLVVPDATLTVNYGLDRVRFPAPVFVGRRVRAHGEITAVQPVPGGYQLTIRMTIAAADATKPAGIADILVRLLGAKP